MVIYGTMSSENIFRNQMEQNKHRIYYTSYRLYTYAELCLTESSLTKRALFQHDDDVSITYRKRRGNEGYAFLYRL